MELNCVLLIFILFPKFKMFGEHGFRVIHQDIIIFHCIFYTIFGYVQAFMCKMYFSRSLIAIKKCPLKYFYQNFGLLRITKPTFQRTEFPLWTFSQLILHFWEHFVHHSKEPIHNLNLLILDTREQKLLVQQRQRKLVALQELLLLRVHLLKNYN